MNTKMTPGRQSMNLPRKTPRLWNNWSITHSISDIPDVFAEHFSTILPKLASEITSPTNGHKSCLEYLKITDNV